MKLTLDVAPLMTLDTRAARAFAGDLGVRAVRPGEPGSAFRQRFVARVVAVLVRRISAGAGVSRLAVRSRPGSRPDQLVVAVPWRHGGRVRALGDAVGDVIEAAGSGEVARVMAEVTTRLAEAPMGAAPNLLRPRVPVVAITGTNGKTTTSRMIGHIARAAGRNVGWCSTEGVFHNGELVETGDYSGPGGARMVLSRKGIQLAVLETARGGILRRGIGVTHNNVSVVTNVTADHLGMDGIDTLDQLAEVKGVVPRITRPGGWCVLNGDDPRTFAMRLTSKGRPWVFSRDADSPSGRAVIDEGGRFTTVLDGWICWLEAGSDPVPVVEVDAVPMTLCGLSRVNVENSLAAASAALGLGFSTAEVADGLTTFDPERNNPGRMNIWTLNGVTIVFDMAHNEASMAAMLEICHGLRAPEGRLLVEIAVAGDRLDEVGVRLGELAGLNADVVEVAQKDRYMRGREQDEINALFERGLEAAGSRVSAYHDSEMPCLESLVAQANPGDVIGFMTHQQRAELTAWVADQGGHACTGEEVRALVEAGALRAGFVVPGSFS
ncbi:Mur ligase family protein [Mariniluteicoccus flavus]